METPEGILNAKFPIQLPSMDDPLVIRLDELSTVKCKDLIEIPDKDLYRKKRKELESKRLKIQDETLEPVEMKNYEPSTEMVAYVGGYGGARSPTEVFQANEPHPSVSFFTSTDASNVEEVVLNLGNKLARECKNFHNKNLEVIETLIDTASVCMSPLRKVARNVFNLWRNKKSRPSIDELKLCLPFLKALLVLEDKEVLVNVCWVLSEISGVSNDHIQLVVEGKVIPRLIELLKVDDPDIILPALHCIGNIVSGTDFQTDAVVGEGVLEVLASLLKPFEPKFGFENHCSFLWPESKLKILNEAAWTLSNITAGNQYHIMSVVQSGCFARLVKISNKIEETENEENPSENLKMLHSRCLDKVDIRWLLWAQQWFEDMEVVKELQKLRGETSFSRVKNEVDRIIAEYYPDVVSILIDEINREIAAQGEKVEDLKSKKVDEAIIDSEVEALLALKREFKALIGTDRKPTTAPVVTAVKPVDQISSEIAAQVDKVDKEMKKLFHLKSKFMVLTGADWKPATALPVSRVMTPVKDNGKANDEKELLKKPQEQEYSFLISGTLPTPK